MIFIDYRYTAIGCWFDNNNPCFHIKPDWESALLSIEYYNSNVLLFLLED